MAINYKTVGIIVGCLVVAAILTLVAIYLFAPQLLSNDKDGFEPSKDGLYRPGLNDEKTTALKDEDLVEDWGQTAAAAELGQDVFDNHTEWTNDPNRRTTTASAEGILEDINIVPWAGLPRTTHTQTVIGDSARIVPSDYRDQVLAFDRPIAW